MKIAIITVFFIFLLSRLAHADQFSVLDGVYDMHIKISDQAFVDELDLKTYSTDFATAGLSGFVTVPERFKAELTGTARFLKSSGAYYVNFTIVAHENGRDFKVVYRCQLANGSSDLQGSAYLEDGSLLGDFTAVKRK